MKILIFHNFYRQYGGEDESVQKETALLSQKGHNVINFFEKSKSLDHLGFFRKAEKSFGLLYSKRIIRRVHKIIETERPNIAHVHNVFPLITPSIYIALEQAGVPVVQTLRNYRFICPNGLLFINGSVCKKCMKGNFMHAVLNKCLHGSVLQSALYTASIWTHWRLNTFPKKLGTIAALSKFMATLLSQKFSSSKGIRVLPNFVDTDPFPTRDRQRGYMLYLGRLSQEKGVDLLVKAFKRIPNVHLKIAGVGPAEDEITETIRSNNLSNVELLGYVRGEERNELLSHALCLIVPSIWLEPFGRVVLEAYSRGVPVIASRIGGLEELIHDSQTGFLFESGNIDQLNDVISQVAANEGLIYKMGETARRLVETQYDPDSHYSRLMEIYMEAGYRT